MTLEEQIKHYRKQAGLSQEKMAEKIGVSRQAITKWENGTGTPDIVNLMEIADLFQISVFQSMSQDLPVYSCGRRSCQRDLLHAHSFSCADLSDVIK